MNPILTKNFTAAAAIAALTIGAFDASDVTIRQAAAASDMLIGVFVDIGADTGERVDLVTHGLASVLYGGTVTRGDLLTADANGKAVKAAFTGAGKVNVIGRAMKSGVAGDIGTVLIAPSSIGAETVQVPFVIGQTDLLAGTSQWRAAPATGNITGLTIIVEKAVTTGGGVTVELATVAVDGLLVTVADAAPAGTVYSDAPSSPTHATTAVTKGDAIEIVTAAAFDTAGALAGYVDITL